MDWKEFFKPTKWKIIVALILPVYFTYTVQYAMAIPPKPSLWYQFVFYPMPLLFVYFLMLTYSGASPIFSAEENILHIILNYIVPLAINYLLACLIIFIFKKYKSRAKK